MPPGEIAADWRRRRLAVLARTADEEALFLDVEALETRSALVRLLAPALARLGISDLDIPTIRGRDRRVNMADISYWAWREVNEDASFRYAGLRYLSRLSTEWECWAVFDRVATVELERRTLRAEMTELRKVAADFNLRVF